MAYLVNLTRYALSYTVWGTTHSGKSLTPTNPPCLNLYSTGEIILLPTISTEHDAGDSSTVSTGAGVNPINLSSAECVAKCTYPAAAPSCDVQQFDAACISTDLQCEIWAQELITDPDSVFQQVYMYKKAFT